MKLFLLVIIACAASFFLYSLIRGIWLIFRKKNGEGVLYLSISSIIGILVLIAIPQFEEYGPCSRPMFQHAEGDLHNLWLICNAYWDTDSNAQCSLEIAKREEYGFVPSTERKAYGIFDNKSFWEECHPGVTYELKASGNEETYKATGSILHNDNTVTLYELDAKGNIQTISPY